MSTNNIGQNCASIDKGEPWEPISQVIVKGDKHTYTAGLATGRTIEVDCAIGTQAIANNLLSMLSGYVYQPFDAKDALVDPSIELGQTISVGDVYSIVASITIKGDMILSADVSAPSSGDVDHEYPYDEWKKTVDAKNIRHGGGGGTMSGEGITGNSLSTEQMDSGVNQSLSDADYSADVFAGSTTADYLYAHEIRVADNRAFYYNGHRVIPITATFEMGDGTQRQLTLLGFSS